MSQAKTVSIHRDECHIAPGMLGMVINYTHVSE